MYGTIRSSYVKAGSTITMDIEIPTNTCAVLKLGAGMEIYEDNNLLGKGYMEMESGKYKLEIRKTV